MIKTIALLSVLLISFYGAVLLIALSSKKYKNRYYLGLFFTCSFLLFVGHFLSFFEYWKLFQLFDPVFLAMLLAFYPFFYLYIHKTFGFRIDQKKWVLHFTPPALVLLGMTITVIVASWESYENYMNNNLYNLPLSDKSSVALALFYKGSRAFHLVQILVYNFIIIRLLIYSKNKLSNLFSNLDKYQLRYFYIINISFLIFMSIPGFYVTLIGRTPLNTDVYVLLLICLLFSTLYVILAIIGLRQVPIEMENGPIHKVESHFEIPVQEARQIESNLLAYFDSEKPWLRSHLNIWDVAKALGTNRTYVSHIINDHMGCNFNNFVNGYRIDEAKKVIKNNPSLSLLEISELSGFGTVSSLIRIFKLHEQCTPTEFKKKYC